MGERNVVRTAEVYRAYSGIAAATVSGVLRMSPMARASDVGGVAVAQRGVRSKFMFGAGEEQTGRQAGRLTRTTALARRNRRTLGEFQSSLHRSLTITQPTPEATPSRIAAVQGKLAARITRCRCRRAHRAS